MAQRIFGVSNSNSVFKTFHNLFHRRGRELQQWKVQFSKIEPMEDTDPPWYTFWCKLWWSFFVHIVVYILVNILARCRMQPRERKQLQKKTFVAQLMEQIVAQLIEQMATTTKKNLLMLGELSTQSLQQVPRNIERRMWQMLNGSIFLSFQLT